MAGMVFGVLAGQAATLQARMALRWGAWLVSAIAFGMHIAFEQVRLRSSPRITALHVASAAALGAFGLALAANVNALATPRDQHSILLILSLAIWPVMTALPACLVALVAATLLARTRRSKKVG
jgi:hypothetical protein